MIDAAEIDKEEEWGTHRIARSHYQRRARTLITQIFEWKGTDELPIRNENGVIAVALSVDSRNNHEKRDCDATLARRLVKRFPSTSAGGRGGRPSGMSTSPRVLTAAPASLETVSEGWRAHGAWRAMLPLAVSHRGALARCGCWLDGKFRRRLRAEEIKSLFLSCRARWTRGDSIEIYRSSQSASPAIPRGVLILFWSSAGGSKFSEGGEIAGRGSTGAWRAKSVRSRIRSSPGSRKSETRAALGDGSRSRSGGDYCLKRPDSQRQPE